MTWKRSGRKNTTLGINPRLYRPSISIRAIVWNENRRQSNLAKHRLDFADLSREFFAAAEFGRVKHGRLVAVGELDGGVVIAVKFRPLGVEAISVISMRPLADEEEAEIRRMIASDPDNPGLTGEQIANMRPLREVFPDLAASIDRELARHGRPPVENPRSQVSIRLDPEVLDYYKSTGKGWQSRINDALRKAAGL